MRTRFDMELDNLNSDMIAMGALCENAISEAMKSLFTADKTAAQRTIEEAVDVLMIAKYLERIGDHATNIAEWVLFSITGTHEL